LSYLPFGIALVGLLRVVRGRGRVAIGSSLPN
jgi:hypothetical protein